MHKKLKYISISVISLVLMALFISSCNHTKDKHDASGTFEATEVLISSEATGKIMEFNIDEGQVLKANQYVGFIDSVQVYLKKKQLLKSIQAVKIRNPEIQKQIGVFEQQIATQKNEKIRVQNLVDANVANQKQLDDINAYIALLERQLTAQKSVLNTTSKGLYEEASAMEVQIEQLNDQLKKCRIINPVDGTVLVKYSEKNEISIPGKVMYKIADLENMTFRAYITSDQISKMKIGQSVKVLADFGDENRTYDGRVAWISSKSEFTPKTIQTQDERANLVYAVKVAVKNDGFLKIGMYGKLNLLTEN